MATYELDKWDIKRLHEYWKKGRLNLTPDYQRSKVWPDSMKYDLIDSVLHEWPMGVIMINIVPDVDEDGESIERYEVVDGQQRLTTLFEYRDGSNHWAVPTRAPAKYPNFRPYAGLSSARQERFDSYKIAMALMKDYEEDDILDIFNRLQHSKPLVIGEKVKALRSDFKPFVHDLIDHRIFNIHTAYTRRDANWNFSSLFFKAAYEDNPYARQEYEHLEDFLRHKAVDTAKAQKALDEVRRTLTFDNRVLEEVQELAPNFKEIGSARLLKWLFAATQDLFKDYNLTGREHLVAGGLVEYYNAKDIEGSDEWIAYYKTGRTGRIDTDDVRYCISQLKNLMVIASEATPLDTRRNFTPEQRLAIFNKSDGRCAICGILLSRRNFHADHIIPYSQGGRTAVENGQALCTKCNREKSSSVVLEANHS